MTGTVVTGSAGVAVVAADKAHFVAAFDRLPEDPLERAVGGSDLDRGFERGVVKLEVGVLSADVRGDDRIGAAIVVVEIAHMGEVGLVGSAESLAPLMILEPLGVPGVSQLKDAVAFTVLVLVLLFKPAGLFGERLSAEDRT